MEMSNLKFEEIFLNKLTKFFQLKINHSKCSSKDKLHLVHQHYKLMEKWK